MARVSFKILIAAGSLITAGFGIWHFTVPRAWNWYSYIDPAATELVLAVRAINVFFSLSLVLFAAVNLLLAFGGRANRYSILVALGATCVLWLTRVGMQLLYPQGSMSPVLQYSMLASFVLALLLHGLAFAAALRDD